MIDLRLDIVIAPFKGTYHIEEYPDCLIIYNSKRDERYLITLFYINPPTYKVIAQCHKFKWENGFKGMFTPNELVGFLKKEFPLAVENAI